MGGARKGLVALTAALFGSLPLACQRDADYNLQNFLSKRPTGTAIVAYPTGTQLVGETPVPPTHATNLRNRLKESGMTTHLRAVPNGQFKRGLLLDHNTEPAGPNLSIFYVDSDRITETHELNGLESVANTYSGVGTSTTVYTLAPAEDGGFSRFENLLERKGYIGGN